MNLVLIFLNVRLQKKLNKHFSRDIRTVISLDDEGSWALTQAIRVEIDDETINWVKFSDISEEALKDSQSVFVVAGADNFWKKAACNGKKATWEF